MYWMRCAHEASDCYNAVPRRRNHVRFCNTRSLPLLARGRRWAGDHLLPQEGPGCRPPLAYITRALRPLAIVAPGPVPEEAGPVRSPPLGQVDRTTPV